MKSQGYKSTEALRRQRRKIPTFETTTHSAFQREEGEEGLPQTQKDELYHQYKLLATEYDNRLLEADYIDRNIANVGDPKLIRMANSTASVIHRYRRHQRSARLALQNQTMLIQDDQPND